MGDDYYSLGDIPLPQFSASSRAASKRAALTKTNINRLHTILKKQNYSFRVIIYKLFLDFPSIPGASIAQRWSAESLPKVELKIDGKKTTVPAHTTNRTWDKNLTYGVSSVDTRFMVDVNGRSLRKAKEVVLELKLNCFNSDQKGTLPIFCELDIYSMIDKWLESEEMEIIGTSEYSLQSDIDLVKWRAKRDLMVPLLADNLLLTNKRDDKNVGSGRRTSLLMSGSVAPKSPFFQKSGTKGSTLVPPVSSNTNPTITVDDTSKTATNSSSVNLSPKTHPTSDHIQPDFTDTSVVGSVIIRIDLLNEVQVEHEAGILKPYISPEDDLESMLRGNYAYNVINHFYQSYINVANPHPFLLHTVLPELQKYCESDGYDELVELRSIHSPNPIETSLIEFGIVGEKINKLPKGETQLKKQWRDVQSSIENNITNYLDQLPHLPKGSKMAKEKEKLLLRVPKLAVRVESQQTAAHPVIHDILVNRWRRRGVVSFFGTELFPKSNILTHFTTPRTKFFLQLAFYAFFVAVLTVPSFSSDDDRILYWRQFIKEKLLDGSGGPCAVGSNFESISSVDEYWLWAITEFAPNLFSSERAMLLIGTPSIRQFRVIPQTCLFPSVLQNRSSTLCYPGLNPFRTNWMMASNGNPFHQNTPWVDEEGTTVTTTFLGALPTGGYVQYLEPSSLSLFTQELKNLRDAEWIDEQTRAVVFDIDIYGANENAFALINIVVEFSSVGKVLPSWTIDVLHQTDLTLGDYTWVEVVVFIFLVGYLCQELQEMILEGSDYWKDIWNIIDLVVYLGLLGTLFLGFGLPGEQDPTKLSGSTLWFYYYYSLGVEIARSVFILLAYIRLLYYIRIRQSAGPVVVAMGKMGQDILNWGFLVVVLVGGYAQLFRAMFKNEYEYYHTLPSSFFSFTRVITTQGNAAEFISQSSGQQGTVQILGNFMLAVFLLFGLIVFINVLIAMMNNTYDSITGNAMSSWGMQFSQLVIRYEQRYWPTPFNILLLIFVLFKKLQGTVEAPRIYKDLGSGYDVDTVNQIHNSKKQSIAIRYMIARARSMELDDFGNESDVTLGVGGPTVHERRNTLRSDDAISQTSRPERALSGVYSPRKNLKARGTDN
eukprot:TRINITY_DN787_c5_g1_i2.p1 TRINITY_DN787_c5_g1~~TRINITY_DN787_c5_g1_i2.p1  ORF type:complete len:1109 (+),score=206.97 TRINITY_DN787_c5_g1_i2:26-3352(+)